MRPKDLKFPFAWQQRRPLIHEGVLIVPKHYTSHEEFSLKAHLCCNRPISVEYCSGNGDWVVQQAATRPDHQWIAVERQFERVRKIWSKMRNQGIDNLLVVCGEAQLFTQRYLWADSVSEIFVNFPDPWPKARHAKHRLIQKPFVDAAAEVIVPGGRAVFVTDHRDYALQMVEQMQSSEVFRPNFPPPHYTHRWEDYGRSWFGDLFEKRGEQIHFIEFSAL